MTISKMETNKKKKKNSLDNILYINGGYTLTRYTFTLWLARLT